MCGRFSSTQYLSRLMISEDRKNMMLPTRQSPMAQSSGLQKTRARRYGFACSNCRRRKARCDGVFPACHKCVVARERCDYDKGPSVAFTVALQHQLKAYEDRIEQLRSVKDDKRDELLMKPILLETLRGGRARAPSSTIFGHMPQGYNTGSNKHVLSNIESSLPPCEVTESEILINHNGEDSEADDIPEEASIGADGQVYFYGKTSLYHVDPHAISPSEQSHEPDSRSDERDEMYNFLSEIEPALLNELLKMYWCWPHHLHCVLCKKIFLRDLQNLGPCISPFLLSSVLAQAARYSTRTDATEVGDHFAKRALQLLVIEVDRGSSIPAIQGLLILSSRECACGRTSQGWLYSGMAFRMARDLGMHVTPQKLGPLSSHFSEEYLALRRQIFWSCYTWDKTISLCLGRTPLITDTIELPTTDTLLDGSDADDEIWQPLPVQSALSESLLQHRALSSMRFAAYCELCIIIYGILDKLYSRPHHSYRADMLTYLTRTLEELDDWTSRLPAELRVQEDTKPVLSPPLHILILNLLNHTTIILLCRPYRTVSSIARARCTKAAVMTDTLFTLHVRRFGFRCITWLQTYTMFVACTINVLDFKDNRPRDGSNADPVLAQEASARLGFGQEVLRQAGSTPSAARCAAIIAELVQNLSEPEQGSRSALVHRQTASGDQESRKDPNHIDDCQRQNLELVTDEQDGVSLPLTVHKTSDSASSHSNMQTNFVQSSSIPTDALLQASDPHQQYQNGVAATNVQLPTESLPSEHDWNNNGIDVPFRWLPENVRDDGSWMLMDMEFDLSAMLNV